MSLFKLYLASVQGTLPHLLLPGNFVGLAALNYHMPPLYGCPSLDVVPNLLGVYTLHV